MRKLRIISIFLALLMISQMLPITQIGQLLSTNQMVEELPHSAAETGKMQCSLEPHFLPPSFTHCPETSVASGIVAYLHGTEQIPSNHATDVVSPPPDVLA